MRTTLTEVGASLAFSAVLIVLGIIIPYRKARARYRRELGF